MKKTFLAIAIVVIVAVLFLVPSQKETEERSLPKGPLIAVSTFALYDIVHHIAPQSVELFMVLPFGTDAHSFEPTPQLLAKLSDAQLFIFSGAGLEPWTEPFENHPNALDIAEHVTLLSVSHHDDEEGDTDEHDHDTDAHHHEGSVDPHYWLDPENMIKATKVITAKLQSLVPESASRIGRNAEVYITQLSMLNNHYTEALKSCKIPEIVVNHNAFNYLATRYGFHVEALSGLSPEAMPSAKTMAHLSDLVRQQHITTLFYESFVSDRLIQNIAQESGAKVEVLQPLANITKEEARADASYVMLMERNLQKLTAAMECH